MAWERAAARGRRIRRRRSSSVRCAVRIPRGASISRVRDRRYATNASARTQRAAALRRGGRRSPDQSGRDVPDWSQPAMSGLPRTHHQRVIFPGGGAGHRSGFGVAPPRGRAAPTVERAVAVQTRGAIGDTMSPCSRPMSPSWFARDRARHSPCVCVSPSPPRRTGGRTPQRRAPPALDDVPSDISSAVKEIRVAERCGCLTRTRLKEALGPSG
jgi:hypothetical protein